MTRKLPILRARKVISVLEHNGFQRIKRSSGHATYRHNDGRWVTVPIHGSSDIGRGLFSKILKSSKKDINEFL